MISAVVINWNGRHYLDACLQAVLDQDLAAAEVLLVDNHSDDGSREWVAAHFPQVRIIDTGHNAGPAAARNGGVAQARHDLVLLVDNDVVLEPTCLRRLAATLDAHPRAALVQPRVLCHDRPDVVHYDAADLHYLGLLVLHGFYQPIDCVPPRDGPVGAAVSTCMLVRRAAFTAVGGFHGELFIYFEDTDLSWRLRLAGYELRLDQTARVLHRGGTAGLSQRPGGRVQSGRTFYLSRNRSAVVLTCLHWRSLLLLWPAQLLYSLVHLAFSIGQGQTLAWLRGKLALLRMLPRIWRWRRAAQRQRTQRDRDLLVAAPLTPHPGLADRGAAAHVRRALDRVFAVYWRLAQPWCG